MAVEQERADIVELSKEEWSEMALGAIKGELGLTAEEFFAKQDAGELEPHPAVPDIMMLLKTRDNFREDLIEVEAQKAKEGS